MRMNDEQLRKRLENPFTIESSDDARKDKFGKRKAIRVRRHGRGHYQVVVKHCVKLAAICAVALYFGLCLGHGLSYNDGHHVCRHMARDAEDILESIGLDVMLYSAGDGPVENGSETRHMWICVNGIHFDSVYLLPFYNFYTGYRNAPVVYNDYQDYLDMYYQNYGVYPDPMFYGKGGKIGDE